MRTSSPASSDTQVDRARRAAFTATVGRLRPGERPRRPPRPRPPGPAASARRPRHGDRGRGPRLSGERPARPRSRAGSAGPARRSDQDAYGRGPVTREVTAIRAFVRHGNSGGAGRGREGPCRDDRLRRRAGEEAGTGFRRDLVRSVLAHGRARPVSSTRLRSLSSRRGARARAAAAGTAPRGRPRRSLARRLDQLAGALEPDLGRIRAGRSQSASCSCVGHDDPRHLVVQPQREPVAREREDLDQHRDRPLAAELARVKRSKCVEVEDDLRDREPRAGLDLRVEPLELDARGRPPSG